MPEKNTAVLVSVTRIADVWSRFHAGWLFWAFVAFVIKLALASFTLGTNDILDWRIFASAIDQRGAIWLYHHSRMFHFSPFMAHVLAALTWFSRLSGLSFQFLLRLPSIVADLGSLWLVARILRPSKTLMILMALAPASILISGFHGNTDPVMIFFVLLAIYYLQVRPAPDVSAIFLGVAVCIKIVPVILAPAILLYLDGNRRRIRYVLIAGATFYTLSLPFIAEDPMVIARNVIGYHSLPGIWGFPRLGAMMEAVSGRYGYIAMATRVASVLVLLLLVALAFWFRRRSESLFMRCAISMFAFLWLAPGFGVQYLAWLAPFAIAFGESAALAVYFSNGLFLALVYTYWSGGIPWYYADSNKVGPWTWGYVPFELAAWGVIGFVFFAYLRAGPEPISFGQAQEPFGRKDRLRQPGRNLS